ncbi:recombinase family protein [Vibrio splendidus]|uniref:recombinase family protein n=2 Tax=Vibrio TaxID=662 RepID=UPI000D354A81|nr:recombinase family protein [Vibrio splendidus]PTP94649.1 recombinase family protein [Vibrio splendidus]
MKFRTAYIYSRVSKGAQAKGDGLRRQIESATNFIKSTNETNRRNGGYTYHIADSLIIDKGLSAYKGLNTEENAGLGAFLEASRKGEIEKGSLLVVEAIDRISRLPADDAREIFSKFKTYGVDVAIVKFGIIIHHNESTKLEHDLLLTAAIHLAHLESDQKSKRIKARFEHKRGEEKKGGEKRTSICPAWMRISDDKKSFELIPNHEAVLKRMIDMKLNGIGCLRIAKSLNEEGILNFSGKKWQVKLVEKYLKMEQLVGSFQRVEHVRDEDGVIRKKPLGALEKHYYPSIIDEATFLRLKKSFKRAGGRQTGAYKNLYSNLLYCPTCGTAMSYFKPNRGKIKIRCRKQIDNRGCNQRALNYEVLEKRLIAALSGLDYAKINSQSFAMLEKEISLLEATITDLEEQQKAVESAFLDEDDVRIQVVFRSKIKAILDKIDMERSRYEQLIVVKQDYDMSVVNELKLEKPEDREKYNQFVRNFVSYIVATDDLEDSPRFIRVVFKAQSVGEVDFGFNGELVENENAVSGLYTREENVKDVNVTRTISLSKVLTFDEQLKEILDVTPPLAQDVREKIRYYFELQQAVKANPTKWLKVAKNAHLPLAGRVI